MSVEIRNSYGERVLSLRQILALSSVAGLALTYLHETDTEQHQREQVIEECVGALVNRDVNLVSEPDTGRIQRPESVYDEVTACLSVNGDPAEAEIIIDN